MIDNPQPRWRAIVDIPLPAKTFSTMDCSVARGALDEAPLTWACDVFFSFGVRTRNVPSAHALLFHALLTCDVYTKVIEQSGKVATLMMDGLRTGDGGFSLSLSRGTLPRH